MSGLVRGGVTYDEVDPAETLVLLGLAAEHRLHVTLHRRMPGADTLYGFVLAYGEEWTLLASTDDNVVLDGWHAVRTRDIDTVALRVGYEPMPVRALKAAGQWPPPEPAGVAVGSLAEVLEMAAANAPVVHVETEETTPDDAYLGRVVAMRDGEFDLLHVGAEGDWDPEPQAFPMAEVTRVDFGGKYETAIAAVAGEPRLRLL